MKFGNFSLTLADKTDEVIQRIKSVVKKSREVERERPDGNTELYWQIYNTDAIVGACIDFTDMFVIGTGMVVTVIDEDGNEVKVPEFDSIIRKSKPNMTMKAFKKDASVQGDGFLEILYSEDKGMITGFQVTPAPSMRVERDGHGVVTGYVQELGDEVEFSPDEIVHYRNNWISGEAYGRSDVEKVTEVSEILRDMIIDLSNFISTKAYPPIVWMFGTPDKPWNPDDIESFMDDREEVEPGDQIGIQGDMDAKAIGVAGESLNIEPYLTFFASMIVSGLKVPATLTSVITGIGQFTADAQANAYTRRINEIRMELSELLEVELFDEIIRVNGYGDKLRSKVTWKKHDDEQLRMAVNNLIQLVQNSVISPEEARMNLSYPMEVVGTLRKAVDKAEGAEPAIDANVDDNNMEDTSDDDGRTEQNRKNFSES